MRVYSTNRPIGMGTWPSQYAGHVTDMVHFDYLTYVPEIRHNSFGYIDFDCDIPITELERYELRVPGGNDPQLERIGEILAKYNDPEHEKALDSFWEKAKMLYGYTDDQLGDAMERHMG